jgi:hypothetical protein
MKKQYFRHILPLTILVSSWIFSTSAFAQTFEGIITLEESGPVLGDQKAEMIISVKGDKSVTAVDFPGIGPMKIYEDKAAKKMTQIFEAQKRGVEIDQTVIDSTLINKPIPPTRASGKKALIRGLNAEEFICQIDSGVEIRMWLTKEMEKDVAKALISSMETGMKAGGAQAAGFLSLFDKGYVPVRTVIMQDGNEQVTVEFAKVEPKKLDDAIFVVPTDIGKLLYIDSDH